MFVIRTCCAVLCKFGGEGKLSVVKIVLKSIGLGSRILVKVEQLKAFVKLVGGHGTGKTGKSGNFNVHFSRQGKQREFAKNIKNTILHREFNSQHGENFEVLQIKRHFRVVVHVATIF